MMTEMKPLTPLKDGIVLIVGTKASNFDDELRNHPRVVMWSSLQEHWTSKDVPTNTRAIFFTRFIGHAAFRNIQEQAIKRHLTMFNPTGTGMIVKQVKELLNIDSVRTPVEPTIETKEITVTATTDSRQVKNKLKPLIPFMDFSKSNAENGRVLYMKAIEMGIESTVNSLAQYTMVQRKKQSEPVTVIQNNKPVRVTRAQITERKAETVDVTVEILDGLIKGLQDMRQFLIDTVEENKTLRARVNAFKTAMEGL